MTNIKKIAKLAGVSVSTVSKALNGYEDIKEETKKKILEIAKEMDYVPNFMARGLITKSTKTVGVFFGDQTNSGFDSPFLVDYFSSIKNVLGEAGYDLLIFSNQKRDTSSYKSMCHEKGVDGVILILTGNKRTDEKIHELHEAFPTVYIDSLPQASMKVNFVESDNEAGAWDATEHLIKLGHRSILKIAGDTIAKGSFDRIEGFKKACQHYGLSAQDNWIQYGKYSREEAARLTKEIFSQETEFTAVFASSDLMAFGVIDALKELGKRVPEDVSVVGFDDIDSAQYFHPPLTTVHQKRLQMGETASKILIEIMQDNDGTIRHMKIPTKLIVRGSSAISKQ
ncbi:LacI family DNA-binding transcriptional regulator [Paenibacillus planticolens]|uniref:LacI family DNA-binding transcriptional regulator n=1 Tax=Paenibacillus planticolens TaxID=2654976 RepID=A0ABX1ZK02_9BACL|nr:LacI family DNA-binding transcriptional regulator [Paenibacillus planticolens]NOU99797.1 LacI family DNA-binding transcriptional regulator [Paenibacillus planticolens]